MVENFDNEEIKEFVEAVIDGIERGIKKIGKGYHLSKGGIEFELKIKNVSKGKGGIRIHVVNIGGEKEKQNIDTIKFTVQKRWA